MNNNNTGGAASAAATANHQMERVTFHLHSRLCNFGLNHTSYRTRKIFEHVLLVLAICCACALLMLHRTFVVSLSTTTTAGTMGITGKTTTIIVPSTCLNTLEGFDPVSADITHLVIFPRNLTVGNLTIDERGQPDSMVLWKRGAGNRTTASMSSSTLQTECASNEFDDDPQSLSTLTSSRTRTTDEIKTCDTRKRVENASNKDDTGSKNPENNRKKYSEWMDQQLSSNTLPIQYSYSTTKAYLMLPHDHYLLKREMSVQYILLSPTDPVCFGEPFVQFLLWNCFIGGNTVLLNWLNTFPAYHHPLLPNGQRQWNQNHSIKGYVYNPRNQWLVEVGGDHLTTNTVHGDTATNTSHNPSRWWYYNNKFLAKFGVFLRTSFLFFFCTTLVSFTLRETQERMLDFTRELSRRVRQSITLSDLITTHLFQNLVFVPIMLGMMFFLIEFYNGDKLLAFSVSSIVWIVESFSLVCLRSSQGLQYFPYFFFLLFLLFHVYQTAFADNGFVYVALAVVWFFVLHSMVFFWQRYELPALVLGNVTVFRPRMNSDEYEYNSNNNGYRNISSNSNIGSNSNRNNNAYHETGVGRLANGMPTVARRRPEQHTQRHHDDRRVRLDEWPSSIDANHLTTPLLTETQMQAADTSTTATMTLQNSSSSISVTAGGLTGVLASQQSFQSMTSSRRTNGLYLPNQEDDSSTGSHLYFMGGEVVVHQQQTPRTHNNHGISNSNSNNDNINHNGQSSSSEFAPPPIWRLTSFNDGSTSYPIAATGAGSTRIGGATEEVSVPLSSVKRNESNFSLLSSASDINGSGSNAAIAGSSGIHDNITSNNTINNNSNTAIGLDVTGRCSGDPENDLVDILPNDTSMETVQASNVSIPQHHPQQQYFSDTDIAADGHNNSYGHCHNESDAFTPAAVATAPTSDSYYAQELGGLQAIFDTQ